MRSSVQSRDACHTQPTDTDRSRSGKIPRYGTLGAFSKKEKQLVLPDVKREVVEDALRQFDADLRQRQEWSGWESNAAQKFALVHNGLM